MCSAFGRTWAAGVSLSFSHKVILFEVVLQDGVLDGGEDEADVFGVSGASEV